MSAGETGGGTNRAEGKPSWAGPMLIGCGTALVVALVFASVMAFLSGKFWDFVSDQSRRMQAEERFIEQWEAPAATAAIEQFSPEAVGDYSLAGADNRAEFPALGIDAAGYHMVYEDGPSTLDVTVYRMDEAEKEALFDEAEQRITDEERFPKTELSRRPSVLDFSVASPEGEAWLAGRFWYGRGWLIFIRGDSDREIAEFSLAYLEAVAGEAGDESGG